MSGSHENKHPDALIRHSIDEVAGKIVGYIRELRPDIVLTFDPIGGYRHPDHILIHKATTLAFKESGNADFHPEAGSPYLPLALYYHTISHHFLKTAIFLLRMFGKDPRRFGRNGDIDLQSIAEIDFPIHVKINIRLVRKKKGMATLCYASQGGVHLQRGLMGWVRWLFGENEIFMRAYPPCAPCEHPANDLFMGIPPE
jgi:LmbE family N-acetylglucosaminyl deacetylase